MPELVALVVGHGFRSLGHQLAVRRDVGDVGDVGIVHGPIAMAAHGLLEQTKAFGKGNLLIVGDVLAMKHENAMGLERLLDHTEVAVA